MGECEELKVWAGSDRWAIVGDDVRELIVGGRGITQGATARPRGSAQGQEAGESHCKKPVRAEPERMPAAPSARWLRQQRVSSARCHGPHSHWSKEGCFNALLQMV